MYDHVLPGLWMLLPKEQRIYLATHFNIPHTGITEVRDNTVISDGYTVEDLSVLTKERLEQFVGSSESFPRLWELTVAKVRSELNPPMGIIRSHEAELPAQPLKHGKETKPKAKKK